MRLSLGIIVVVFASRAVAQVNVTPPTSYDYFLSPAFAVYAGNRLSPVAAGRGFAGIADAGTTDAYSINPAACRQDLTLSLYCNYLYKSTIPWFGFELKQLHLCLAAGAVWRPRAGLAFTAGYGETAGYRLDSKPAGAALDDPASIMREDWSEELPQYTSRDDVRFRTVSAGAALSMNRYVALGARLDYRIVSHDQRIGSATWRALFYAVRSRFGLILSPLAGLDCGLFYEPQTEKRFDLKFTGTGSGQAADTSMPSGYGSFEPPDRHYVNNFPLEFGCGLSYLFQISSRPVRVYADYHFSNSGIYNRQADRHDANVGAERTVGRYVWRAGAFSQTTGRSPLYPLPEGADLHDQYFLTCGATKTLGPLVVSVALMDSHLLSRGSNRQFQAVAGIAYNH